MTLVRIVKGWVGPNFLRQTHGSNGTWDDIQFTFDPVEECDFLIMLNNLMQEMVTVKTHREHVWALMQEPYLRGHSDWMIERHDPFARVFTNHTPSTDGKYIISHPADPWHVEKSFDELTSMHMPEKTKKISWIAGNATDLPGHYKRMSLLKYVREDASLEIDFFGRAIRYIEDKWNALAPYRYSVVLQNSSSPDYWTDMLADCFLSWTVPIYYGCTNLKDYFPKESFIAININDKKESVARIKEILHTDNWEKRRDALEEARTRILHKYQFFPHVAQLIKNYGTACHEKQEIRIPPYRRTLKSTINRILYKMKKKFFRFIN